MSASAPDSDLYTSNKPQSFTHTHIPPPPPSCPATFVKRRGSSTPGRRKTSVVDGGGSACAACKYQRRKCTPDCPLAPYFPADDTELFVNAHRLFGVHNILRTIKSVSPEHRDDAVKSIVFSANARARDSVGGCYRMVCELRRRIERASAELRLVRSWLAMVRLNEAARVDDNNNNNNWCGKLIVWDNKSIKSASTTTTGTDSNCNCDTALDPASASDVVVKKGGGYYQEAVGDERHAIDD